MDPLLYHREPPRDPEWWARVESLDEQMDEAALRAEVFDELAVYVDRQGCTDIASDYAEMAAREWDRYRRLRDERDAIERGDEW